MKALIQKVSLIIILSLMIVGFSDNAFAEICSNDGWCLQTPEYIGGEIRGMWCDNASNKMYLANNTNKIIHYNGTSWEELDMPEPDQRVTAIWGATSTDIYAGTSTGGYVYRYNGTEWSSLGSVGLTISAIWGTSGTNVFFARSKNIIGHSNGVTLTTIEISPDTDVSIMGLWGTAVDNIYAVGSKGSIIRFNGASWTQESIPAGFETTSFHSVWGSSPSDIFVAGQNGTILHWNGTGWSQMTSGTTERLRSVWGNSSTDVCFAGENGTLLHYAGSSIETLQTASPKHFNGVIGRNGDDFYVYGDGGTLIHYDEKVRNYMAPGYGSTINDIWGTSASNAYAVGDNGVIMHYDGTSWRNMDRNTDFKFTSVWGTNDGSVVYAAGHEGAMMVYRGAFWEKMDIDSKYYILGLWGTSANAVYAAGLDAGLNKGAVLFYDGQNWRPMTTDTSSALYSIWGTSGSDILAVGNNGTILHYNGAAWSPMASETDGNILDVWGSSGTDIYFVVESTLGGSQPDGVIHYDEGSWNTVADLSSYPTQKVWGSSAGDVFVTAGDNIFHFDGSEWVVMSAGNTDATMAKSLWGASSSEVFAGGYGATIIKYSGTAQIYSISGTVTGDSVSNIPVVLSGQESRVTTTDSEGKFIFSGLANGDYQVTLIQHGFTFSPSPQSITMNSNSEFIEITSIITPQTYSVSGTVSGDLSKDVILTVSGDVTAAAITGVDGSYAIYGLSNGDYTVTAIKEGYSFSPVSRDFTITGTDQADMDFTATTAPGAYSITGSVTGDTIPGVLLTLAGPSANARLSDLSGNFSFIGLQDGVYTITPQKDGYTFTPASCDVTISGGDSFGIQFAATALPGTYSISGTVKGDQTEGIIIGLSGDTAAAAVTGTDGSFSFSGLSNGDYTLLPIKEGLTFLPAVQTVTLTSMNQTGIDFEAAPTAETPQSSSSDNSSCFIGTVF